MHKQPTAGPSGLASHNLSGDVPRSSDDLSRAGRPHHIHFTAPPVPGAIIALDPADLLTAAELKALGLPAFAPESTLSVRLLDLVIAANGYRPCTDWAGDQLDRARSAWLLVSPSGAIVSMGLSHHQAMRAAGLGVELPAGFRVARLTVDGDLAAFDTVLDTLHGAWTGEEDLSPELRAEWERADAQLAKHYQEVEQRLDLGADEAEARAAERERISRELAATPVEDPAAEPLDLPPDGDTEELPFDAGVCP